MATFPVWRLLDEQVGVKEVSIEPQKGSDHGPMAVGDGGGDDGQEWKEMANNVIVNLSAAALSLRSRQVP